MRRHLAVAAAVLVAVAATACIPFDFRGPFDGADLIYVDDDGTWWIVGDPDPLWAGPPDGIAVAGDYDGNNRTEPAAYVPATGMWHTAGARGTFHYPAPADPDPVTTDADVPPVPADYDGDGDTDPAFFVEDTATWIVEGADPIVFGRPTDHPGTPVLTGGGTYPLHDVAVPADHDGDGTDEPAVYRPYTGTIHVHGEPDPIDTDLPYGRPAAANLDGQPGDEFVVVGLWSEGWWIEGAEGRTSLPASSAMPVVGDYDGDGIAEIAAIVAGSGSGNWDLWTSPGSEPVAASDPHALRRFVNAAPNLRDDWLLHQYAADSCLVLNLLECPEAQPLVLATEMGFVLDEARNVAFAGPGGGLPVPADYDGDGSIDHAIYDPVTGTWATGGARGSFTRAAPPDVDADPSTSVHPVPGDYDGDGDADPAFFREADATWWIDGAAPVTFGRPTASAPTFDGTPVHDIPIPGDYDGDGETEIAVYRIDTGEYVFEHLGAFDPGWLAGDPVVGDFDDDGDDDAGLWDDSNGTEGAFRYGGAEQTTPYPGVTGHPIAAPWLRTGGDQLSVIEPRVGGGQWRVPGRVGDGAAVEFPFGENIVPAVGDHALWANRLFVDAYVSYCVEGTPLPGECTS